MNAILGRFVKKHYPDSRGGHGSLRESVLKHRLIARPGMWIVFAAATALPLGSVPTPPRAFSTASPLPVEIQQRATPEIDQAPPLTGKKKQDLLKSNFEKVKRDAADLVALAKSLQEDLDKSNENVLSLKVVEKAEKIEKLARKIKITAKGD